jgi:TolA-binding protein
MANELNQPTFSSEKPEPSEFDRITERINNFKVGLTPSNAQTVNTILEKGLSNGIFKLSEVDALVAIREEVNKGVIDYNTQVQVAQKRIQELQEEQLVVKQQELAKREAERSQELTDERQRRKKAEDEVRILKAQLEALSGVAGNVTQAPIPVEQPHAPKVEKPKSKAWDMIRAARPQVEEVEEEANDLGQDLPTLEEIQIPEDAKTVKDFYEEVEKVSLDDELDAAESEFKFVEEDEETKPSFSGPKITGGNAPNLKAAVELAPSIQAKVDTEKKSIKSFDSEEELLADAQARIDASKESEEEFEEVTIPSESELRAMTKSEISDTAKVLGFESVNTNTTKDVMIENFIKETESFITNLQESGEFVSASETNDDNGKDDIRDGGYF